jgi:hypothetical protein
VLDPQWRNGADGEALADLDAQLPPAPPREAAP